jgi:hypothetical protein
MCASKDMDDTFGWRNTQNKLAEKLL